MKNFFTLVLSILMLSACSASNPSAGATISAKTVKTQQKKIQRGMSQEEVADELGDPTVVTRDGSNIERWIYESLASKAWYSEARSGSTPINGPDSSSGPDLFIDVRQGDPVPQNQFDKERPVSIVIKYTSQGLVDTATFHVAHF